MIRKSKRTPTPLRPNRGRKKPKLRERDLAYMKWIKTLPCVCCAGLTQLTARIRLRAISWPPALHQWWNANGERTEAAHVGDRGLAQKSSDRETIPLCSSHHREGHESAHVMGKRFWDHHRLNKEGLIRMLNAAYDRWKAAQ